MRDAIAEWHTYSETDEMFVVLSGSVTIATENGSFALAPNDCCVNKAGTQHQARTATTVTLITSKSQSRIVRNTQ